MRSQKDTPANRLILLSMSTSQWKGAEAGVGAGAGVVGFLGCVRASPPNPYQGFH